ncbi:unnamed protein product [Camellia sinensis]
MVVTTVSRRATFHETIRDYEQAASDLHRLILAEKVGLGSSADTGKGKSKMSKHPDFWTETEDAVRRAYRTTDTSILDKSVELGKGGSTAVTAILIDCQKLVVANVGDSRAVAYKDGVAKQLSVDHEPSKERTYIEDRGGFVSNFPGNGQLAVARAFGDKSLKKHLSSEPDVSLVDEDTEFVILASDGIWKVMTNQEAVECIRNIKDAKAAAKHLTC